MTADGVVFFLSGDHLRVYDGVEAVEREVGNRYIGGCALFSIDGTELVARPAHSVAIRLSAGPNHGRAALVAWLRRAFAEADLPLPNHHADDPASYAKVIREATATSARNLDRALQPVLTELSRFHPGLLRADPFPFGVMLGDSVGLSYGIDYRSVNENIAWSMYCVATVVQDAAIQALSANGRPPTWPECPQHRGGHPLSAELTEDELAMWICPASKAIIGAIGQLAVNA